MPGSVIKEKLIEDIEMLPAKRIKEVVDFVEYLKLKEDEWFIALVNRRGMEAKAEKKAGEKLTKLNELQKHYR